MNEDAPQSPADPRPGNHPYYVKTTCNTCDTPLVLSDVFKDKTGEIWHDEWICPNHPEEGVIMDWPQKLIERLRGRTFEIDMEPDKLLPLADLRDEGGFKFDIHPKALAELEASGLDVNEIIAMINEEETKRRDTS